jgi:hypothetical protein
MDIDHSPLSRFEPILAELHHYAFHAGIDALQERGLLREDRELPTVLRSPSAKRRFLRGCHYGFDITQRRAGRIVIEYERLAREYRGRLKEARRNRDAGKSQEIQTILGCLSVRQLILRRLIDSILWQLVSTEPWILAERNHHRQ